MHLCLAGFPLPCKLLPTSLASGSPTNPKRLGGRSYDYAWVSKKLKLSHQPGEVKWWHQRTLTELATWDTAPASGKDTRGPAGAGPGFGGGEVRWPLSSQTKSPLKSRCAWSVTQVRAPPPTGAPSLCTPASSGVASESAFPQSPRGASVDLKL